MRLDLRIKCLAIFAEIDTQRLVCQSSRENIDDLIASGRKIINENDFPVLRRIKVVERTYSSYFARQIAREVALYGPAISRLS